MSQLESMLRNAKPVAPSELRDRVRLVAAQAPPPTRSWRRPLLVAIPVLAAAVAATVALYPRSQPTSNVAHNVPFPPATAVPRKAISSGAAVAVPASNRLQRTTASLQLQVKDSAAVSSATKAALSITQSLHGYPQSVDVGDGYASLTLRIPKPHVTVAVRRLGALGTITSENFDVQDLQAGVNATDRTIAGLQRQLAALRTQPQTARTLKQIDAVTAHVQRLQRQRAATIREAHYGTVNLQLSAKPHVIRHHHPGPLHGLGTAFRWVGIGLVYALAIGAPFALAALLVWLAVSAVRRRREEQLLSRP